SLLRLSTPFPYTTLFRSVRSIQQNRALLGVVEAREQADQRGLPRARRPNDAEPRPGRDDAGDIVLHRPVGPVGERHAAELEGAARPLEGARVGPLGDLGLLVEQREGPLGAREVGLDPRCLLADRLEGLVTFVEVPQRHPQLPDGRRMRGRYRRDSMNSGGDTPRATSASCQSRRRVTTIIMTSVTAAATNGMIPSTMILSITAASC